MKHKVLTYLIAFQLLAALSLAAALHIRWWPFEVLLSYTPLLVVLLTIGLAVSGGIALTKRYDKYGWHTFGAIIIGLAACGYVLYASLTIQPPTTRAVSSSPAPITFISFNKLISNDNVSAAADYFKSQKADVVTLQETRPEEVEKIRRLMGYEYSVTSKPIQSARRTVVAIISRHPIAESQQLELENGPSLVRAVITTPENERIAFYGTHLPGPFTPSLYEKRGRSFMTLAKILQRDPLPVALGGDFNTTVFSPDMRQFNDTVKNKLQPTTISRWPKCSWYGFGAPLCIKIDHIYIPQDAKLIDTAIAPNLGSDHRAVVVRFKL